ncbi:MAG: hypothetical protein DMF63_14555 [Acidobacteria bacterium]|nr:MAG: hypothetical protein DMF63_14555 [Acidobacteriota bacterium]
MAFLGRPQLGLNTPTRPSPTSPGSVRVDIAVPLFVERLEGCFARACPDAVRDPIYQLNAEIWSSDRNEPALTYPLFEGVLVRWVWANTGSSFKKVAAGDLASVSPVSGNPGLGVITFQDTATLPEGALNEDFGPFPPPGGKPLKQTRDELFLRVYLASVFSAWQTIQTIDSNIETAQFFGP